MLQKTENGSQLSMMQKKSATLSSLNLPQETKKVIQATIEHKIQDLSEDGFRQIHIVLLKWGKFLGIKEMPQAEEIKMMVFFIKQQFGELTLSELTNAFNLAIGRKLDIDPNHYQNFSALYVGGILNAYKEYKKTHIKVYRDKEDKALEEEATRKARPSDEELQEMRLKALLNIWDNYKSGEEPEVEWQVTAYYDILNDAGLINLSNEEKKDIAKRAKSICSEEIRKSNQNEFRIKRILKEIAEHSPKNPSQKVVNRCKLLATQNYFDILIRDEVDLREQLNLKSDDRFEVGGERAGEGEAVGEI